MPKELADSSYVGMLIIENIFCTNIMTGHINSIVQNNGRKVIELKGTRMLGCCYSITRTGKRGFPWKTMS